ncbi:MAG: hypothetical protein IH986_14095 [Planctomycetes bacterium]|nr:hypothetical protein [Planctomycetota bacterium]
MGEALGKLGREWDDHAATAQQALGGVVLVETRLNGVWYVRVRASLREKAVNALRLVGRFVGRENQATVSVFVENLLQRRGFDVGSDFVAMSFVKRPSLIISRSARVASAESSCCWRDRSPPTTSL